MMEPELLKMVAGAAAREVASEIVVELRSEIAEQFSEMKEDLKREIKDELRTYFGEMKPSHHIIQHDRLYRFIAWYDEVSGKFWGKVAMGVILAGILALGGMWAIGRVIGV